MKTPALPASAFSRPFLVVWRIPKSPCLRLPGLKVLSAAFALLIQGTTDLKAQNLVFNGGFESPQVDPGSFIVIQADQVSLPNWQVTETSVDVVHQGYLTATAAEGFQFLDLDGSPGPGGISQELATLAGVTYELTFQYADNFLSERATSFALVRLSDQLGDVMAPVTISHNSSVPGNLNWSAYSTTFTATHSATTLRFSSLNQNASGGILLDNVSVVAVPEPSSLALVAASVACWGICLRRRF